MRTIIFSAILFALLTLSLVEASSLCPAGAIAGLKPTECYFSRAAAAWFDAEDDCVLNGGHLASVHDAFTNSFIARLPNLLQDGSAAYWLGGSVGTDSSDAWAWTDGSKFGWTRWDKGFPYRNGTYCVQASSTGEGWESIDCGIRNPYICLVPSETPAAGHNAYRFQSGWTYLDYTQHCYKTFHDAYYTWYAANGTCQTYGASLVSIHSGVEQQFVKELSATGVPMNWKTGAWDAGLWIGMIGISSDTPPNDMRWTDGTPIDYANWTPGRPLKMNSTTCSTYYPDYFAGYNGDVWHNTWENDNDCGISLRAFMCKKAAEV